jgi:hypothetical protein
MFKDRTTKRWKALSKRIGEFEWRWGLTGTPAPNHLMEMWAQMFLLDAGTRLGPLFTRFRALHFYALDYNEYEWAPFEGAEEKIYESLRDICFRAELTGHAPALRNVIRLELPHEARELYKQIKTEMATVYKNCDVVAPNPAVVVGKLLQITSGRVYDDARNVLDIHDVKIRALEQLVTNMQGEPLLVVYGYQHELEAIRTALPAARMLDSEEAIEAWNRGEIEVGLAHAASLGHGVNLQHGGHHMVWTTPTFSNEQHEQMIGRLKRQGQQHQVVVHYLVMDGTVDEMVLEVLDGKQSRQQAALEALK